MQQRQSPMKLPGLCNRCHKPGHWANSCPENSNNRSPVSRPVNSDDEFPRTQCRCGAGFCDIHISKSITNPNRKYYGCPGKLGMQCKYFKWCDKLSTEELMEVRPEKYPICACEAGVSRVLVEENGVNAGLSYFACHIKKGEGACNFKQWLDESPESASVTSDNPFASQTSLMDEFKLNREDEMQLDAVEMIASENPVDKDQAQIEGEEEMPGEAYGLAVETVSAPPRPFLVENNVTENMDSKTTIQSSHTFTNQMSISSVDSMQGCITTVVGALNMGSPEENLTPLDAQPKGRLFSNSQSPLKDDLHEDSIMTGTILGTFEKLALQLQSDLITLFESMSPQNHESMSKEADCTFTALNSLQVDYEPFQSRVNDYIKQAASLARIEQIINEDISSQELVNHHNNEQRRFKELLKSHHEARAAFIASNSQLSLLCEKASSLDSLAELTMELLSCEADNAGRQETMLQVTKTLAECKASLLAAPQIAEEALKKCKEMEIERNAAQVAFQTARAQLRN
ncbi:hypothetical protein RND81_04G006100 [Saponaria officinalis]|uniref:CCHC-type domain-containing protein n=1 Tax=Saponaria officinalis TaxID=3572 RepID=A0AAW1LHJ6_SAPOF